MLTPLIIHRQLFYTKNKNIRRAFTFFPSIDLINKTQGLIFDLSTHIIAKYIPILKFLTMSSIHCNCALKSSLKSFYH